MPLIQAREEARNQGLDLVQVAPTAVPSVCRLLDYGKYKYEQAKKEREAKKGQRLSVLREVRVRPKIGNHDFEAKARTAKKLLGAGDKVRVTVMFRGREVTHPELGMKLLQRMAETLQEVSDIESKPIRDGRRMFLILVPSAASKQKKVKEEAKEVVKKEEVKEEVKEETKES